jgi:NAD(P)-dependent dehydrogenase (short-subunit alcohol dehydrogenase family)
MNTNIIESTFIQITLKLLFVASLLVSSISCAQSDSDAGKNKETYAATVLITGANRGIGLELARQYSEAGWQVIGTARQPDRAMELANLNNARVVQLDVTDQDSVMRLVNELSGQSIDLLINNAGILPMMRSVANIDIDQFEYIVAVNSIGPVRVTQALLPNLRASQQKKIINITSNLGSITDNTNGGFYGYRESKAALNMFTRSLAAELRPEGFICIVIHPGWVQTDMGGANAPVPVQESATGIRSVLDSLAPEDSGKYWTFEGEQIPW